MSSSSAPSIKAYKSDAAIGKFLFVKAGTDEKHVALAGAGENTIGINMGDAVTAAEKLVEIARPGFGGKITLAATIAAGVMVKSDAAGKAVAAVATDRAGAVLVDAGVSGDVVACEVIIATA